METAVHHEDLLAEMDWVRALARRLLADAARADDVAQEALTRAMASPAHGPRRGPTLRAFLATATRIVARDQRRSERRRDLRERVAARPEATRSTLELVERRSVAAALAAEIEALDEPYRSAVRLRYLEQVGVREIAARTGTRPVTVRKRLSRGLAMLRARLESEWGDAPGAWATLLLPLAGPGARHAWMPVAARAAGLVVAAGLTWIVAAGALPEGATIPPPVRPAAVELSTFEGARRIEAATAVATPRAEERRAAARPALATRVEPELDERAALLGAAFAALHAVGRAGEVVCADALEQQTTDCSACHGDSIDAAPEPARDGWVVLRFEDGTPRAEGRIVHGARHGDWTEWHPGGEVSGRGAYFDGDRHGWWTLWAEDGEHKRAEGEYQYGQREGTWLDHAQDGARSTSAEWRRGKRHGLERVWHPGGERLARETVWHAGEREGLARTWHATGVLASEGRFARGEPIGAWRFWNEDGQPLVSPPASPSGAY